MYSESYRKAAVAEYFDKGKNASQVAPHYNVHVSTLLRWVEKECGAPVPEKHHRGKYAGKLSVDDVQYSKRAASKYPIKTVTESVNARRAEDGKGPVCDRPESSAGSEFVTHSFVCPYLYLQSLSAFSNLSTAPSSTQCQ